jgi:uncharacterized metal-binding protein
VTAKGYGKMFSLAGIGGRVSGIMKSTETASAILAIDGCAQNCAKKSLEAAGFTKFEHMQLSNLGFQKGESLMSEEALNTIAERGKAIFEKGALA